MFHTNDSQPQSLCKLFAVIGCDEQLNLVYYRVQNKLEFSPDER